MRLDTSLEGEYNAYKILQQGDIDSQEKYFSRISSNAEESFEKSKN